MFRSIFGLVIAMIGLAPALNAAEPLTIPNETAAYLSFDVVKLRKNAIAELIRVGTDGATAEEWNKLAASAGFDVSKVERVTVLAPTFETMVAPRPKVTPTSKSAILAVTCSAPVDPEALKKACGPESREKKYKDASYRFHSGTWTGLLVLPGNTTFLIASEDSIVWYLDRLAAGDKTDVFAGAVATSQKRTVVLVANPPRWAEQLKNLPPELRAIGEAKTICVEIDLEEKLKADIRFDFPSEQSAKAGLEAVKKAAEMGRKFVAFGIAGMEEMNQKEKQNNHLLDNVFFRRSGTMIAVGFLHRVDKELEALPLAQSGNAVTIAYDKVNIPAWAVAPALTMATAGVVSSSYSFSSPAVNYADQEKNRKKLFDAFEEYHEKHGHYPPAVTTEKAGEAAKSWRVELLPFMGEKELYDQFKHNEPWDSLHNKKLIEKIPAVYGSATESYMYGVAKPLVVVGPGTMFDPKATVKKSDLVDPANTILWAETYAWRNTWSNIYWTKPEDALYEGDTPPNFFGDYTTSFSAMMADGKWRYFDKQNAAKDIPRIFLVKPKD